MRYVSGFLYALVIARGTGTVPFEWGSFVCMFLAVVTFVSDLLGKPKPIYVRKRLTGAMLAANRGAGEDQHRERLYADTPIRAAESRQVVRRGHRALMKGVQGSLRRRAQLDFLKAFRA